MLWTAHGALIHLSSENCSTRLFAVLSYATLSYIPQLPSEEDENVLISFATYRISGLLILIKLIRIC
jgi:hypothetical protein